eukprot:4981558-Prymnesium_polylepis.1
MKKLADDCLAHAAKAKADAERVQEAARAEAQTARMASEAKQMVLEARDEGSMAARLTVLATYRLEREGSPLLLRRDSS